MPILFSVPMLRKIALAGALIVSTLMGCGDSTTGPSVDEPELTPVEARISGTRRAFISYDGRAPLEIYSDQSRGDIASSEVWYRAPDGSFSERWEGQFWDKVDSPGPYRFYLELQGEDGSTDLDSLEVMVEPSLVVGKPVRPILHRVRVEEGIYEVRAYYHDDGRIRTLATGAFMNTPGLNHAMDGLAASIYTPVGESYLDVIDLETGESERLLDRTGVIRAPQWHPSDTIVAFTDDFRIPARISDELNMLIRKEGEWEEYFPGGPEANPEFYGQALSWSPTGDSLALSSARTADRPDDRRVVIYTDLFGEPRRERVTTEEHLQDIAQTMGGSSMASEGPNGVAYGPDGQHLYYPVLARGASERRIIEASVNGGEPRIISPVGGPLAISPDGNYAFFMYLGPDQGYDPFMIYRVHTGGEGKVDPAFPGIQPVN